MGMREDIVNGMYVNTFDYPRCPVGLAIFIHRLISNMEKDGKVDPDKVRDKMIEHMNKIEIVKAKRLKYKEEDERIYNQFKRDLLIEFGLFAHPNREKLFEKVWERGHDCGFFSVYQEMEELVELLD